MRLHETKKLISRKTNNHYTEGVAHTVGENLYQVYIWQGIANQNLQRAQKTKFPKNQW
jgi:hypothetical protein